MKRYLMIAAMLLMVSGVAVSAQGKKKQVVLPGPEIVSQWQGKKVAYLGDSITDKNLFKNENYRTYWSFLQDILGIEPLVYGINGQQMSQIIAQAQKLEAENGQDFDAIMIFMGTNDYNASVPVGEWFTEKVVTVNADGNDVPRLHREPVMSNDTFKARINMAMAYLKKHFPTKQIILLTPIHRGYAKFGDRNVQPDENYANGVGSYIDEYVQAIKEASNVWAVPVIDLNSISGLYPLESEQLSYFKNKETDQLHPNITGHRRMAYSIAYQLLAYPATFAD